MGGIFVILVINLNASVDQWLKFVKKRGTSIYLLRVYVIPSTLCIHCTFLLWHSLQLPIFYEDSRIIGIDSINKPQ